MSQSSRPLPRSHNNQPISESLITNETISPRPNHHAHPQPLTDPLETRSSSSTSDLDLEYGSTRKLLHRFHLRSPQTSSYKPPQQQCTQWRPSRGHVFILLSITILLLLGILIWFSLLTSFLHHISHPPAPNNGIIRLINNMTSSISSLTLLQSYQPFPADFTRDILPIPCHSHNDYWRHIPLLDAIAAGCTSVEADIWAFTPSSQAQNTRELYVGHATRFLTPERTLRGLYLDPLMYILDQLNGNTQSKNIADGRAEQAIGVFEASPNTTLVLLLDFKESASDTDIWTLVQEHLQPLREKNYLTFWDRAANKRVIGLITIVASGVAPFDLINNLTTNQHQDIFFDAPLEKLNSGSSTIPSVYTQANSYYASMSLPNAVGKVWFGLTSAQLKTIEKQIEMANEVGLLSRYWNTPSWPVKVRNAVWEQLIQRAVGVLNVDELWTASMRDWRICWAVGWGICA